MIYDILQFISKSNCVRDAMYRNFLELELNKCGSEITLDLIQYIKSPTTELLYTINKKIQYVHLLCKKVNGLDFEDIYDWMYGSTFWGIQSLECINESFDETLSSTNITITELSRKVDQIMYDICQSLEYRTFVSITPFIDDPYSRRDQ